MLFSAELIHSINTPPFNNTRVTVPPYVPQYELNPQTLQDYHAHCFVISFIRPPLPMVYCPTQTHQTATLVIPLRHSFDMEHPSYAAPNHRSEIILALYEASALKAEWAGIRISGQFNPWLGRNIYIFHE